MDELRGRKPFRPRVGDVARMLAAWATSSVALVVAAGLLPGLSADPPGWFIAVAAVTAAFGIVVRPLLVGVAAVAGWWAVALLAVCGQAVVMHLALLVVPGIVADSFWVLVAATWIAAALSTLITWLSAAGTDEAFAASVRRSRRRTSVTDPEVDGVLFVQLDGVSYPVAQWGLQSGSMPTLHRWVDEGTHRLCEWTVQLPCTTPASQLGILHGTCAGVPAFRWYDRELGRVVVANRPGDAALIEERASDGSGLLADDGMAVSNLFSGDAPRTSMTMSKVSVTRASLDTRRAVGRFVVRPEGFLRSMTRTTAEIAKERFQAVRQRRRHVRPRVRRSWTFAALRAVTNGLLRDLNTAIVAQELMKGTRSIYVDYVDYDEVAHHAGGNRLEALRVLESLDQVLGVLERVAADAPRRYRIVVLSDHGQAQGEPFAARYGQDLGALCAELARADVDMIGVNVEGWGRVDSLVEDLAGQESVGGRAADSVAARVRSRTATAEASGSDTELVVLGSGNLGLVFARGQRRLLLEEVEERWPRLVEGLRSHPGVSFVAGLSAEDGPLVLGVAGSHRLGDGHVFGSDPLAGLGPHASAVVRAAVERPEAPELYVNSVVDPSTLEVAAFEDLLGCHGGLGGWQDRGTLLAPVDLLAADVPVQGADELHRLLVSMLEKLGHRTSLPPVGARTGSGGARP